MSKRLNKGFTLIELLVVIAIIGVLSSITLTQLNSARNKSADASVKSNLQNIRSVAENLYDAATGTNGYNQVCANATVSAMRASALSAGGNGETCANGIGYWVAWAGLKGNIANAWCVDNTGNSRQVLKPVSGITTCPAGN